MEFLRTSVGAKAAANEIGPTSQPAENQNTVNIDMNLPATQNNQIDPFGAHPDADAANGLFMLAQSNGARSGNQFAVPQQAPVMASNAMRTNNNGNGLERPSQSIPNGPESPGSPGGSSSEEEEQPAKPATRSRGKKNQEAKPANNRRKAADTPAKTPANKRQKGNNGQDTKMMESSPMSDEAPTHHKDGRKMTDEEKRKNFLERNR
jgi:ATF/CREB family transcription factor